MSIEKSLPSLDARELLISSGKGDFYNKSHEIGGNYIALWGFLDAYIQNLEPIAGYYDAIIPIEKHSPQYRETRRKLYIQITKLPGFDIKNVDSIQITENGILSINNNSGIPSQTFNIIEGWNNILLPRPSTEVIKTETRKGLEALEKETTTESFFDGSIILSYLPATLTTAVSAHSLWSLGTGVWRGAVFVISKITIRNTTTGKMEVVSLSELYKGTKEAIRASLLKILEKNGYVHNPKEGGFYSLQERALLETKQSLAKMTYDDFRRQYPESQVSRGEFDSAKEAILTKIETLPTNKSWGERINSLMKLLGRNVGELIFFPVFFSHFSKYQDTSTFLRGVSEMALFTTGSKLITGTKLGAKLPIPFYMRPIAGMTLGGAMVLGGKEASTILEMNRKKWQYMFDSGFGSLYTDGKSTTGHLASNLGIFNISEYLDLFNKGGQALAEMTGKKSDDLDIGIPRIEIPTPFGTYIGTIPEVNLFQSTVNFGTNPWDWMRGALGRDVDEWNKKVFLYEGKLVKDVENIVTKYLRDESMFASKSKITEAGSKETLLKIHLLAILSGGGDGTGFNSEKGRLIEGIVAYAQSLDKNKPNFSSIQQIIRNRTRQMVIDDFFLESRSKMLELQQSDRGFRQYIPIISKDTKKQLFIGRLLDRMIAGKPIVAEGKWEKTEILGMSSNKWIPSEENRMFQELLSDKTIIEVSFPGFSGQTTTANAFSLYLEMLLEHKREYEFIAELKKGNKKGVQWTL